MLGVPGSKSAPSFLRRLARRYSTASAKLERTVEAPAACSKVQTPDSVSPRYYLYEVVEKIFRPAIRMIGAHHHTTWAEGLRE